MQRVCRAALALLVLAGVSNAALAADKVKIGTSGLALLWTFIDAGVKAGTWQKHGIEPERVAFAGDANMQQGLASASVDFGFGSGPGMAYHSKGVPAVAVAAIAGPPCSFVLMVRPNSRLKTADDLKGARVGVTTEGSVTQWLVRELSRQKGWGSTGITDVPLGTIRTQFVALKAGELDASVTTVETSLTYEAEKEGRTLLNFCDLVKDFHAHVAFARMEHVEKNPDLVRRVLKGWFATVDFMKANRSFIVKEAAASMRYPEAIIDKAMDGQFRMLSKDGAFSPAALDKISKSFVEMGILPAEPERGLMYVKGFTPVEP